MSPSGTAGPSPKCFPTSTSSHLSLKPLELSLLTPQNTCIELKNKLGQALMDAAAVVPGHQRHAVQDETDTSRRLPWWGGATRILC